MQGRNGLTRATIACTTAAALLTSCAQTPLGPTVQVMPGPGKSFDAFQGDQSSCKVYAGDQVKGQAEQSNQRAAGAAVLTALLGAGLGAAVGGGWGAAGQGAGIGAASGAVTGTAIAADMSSGDQYNIQVQYDNAYSQCMYSKGEMVPGYAPPPVVASSGGYSGPDPALVRSVQVELVRLSYLQDAPDGVDGAHTRGAIQSFERANAMRVDGAPTNRLLAKLQATPTSQTATASAPSGWVAPVGSAATAPSAQASTVQPASAPATPPAASSAPAAPSGWVTPVKSP